MNKIHRTSAMSVAGQEWPSNWEGGAEQGAIARVHRFHFPQTQKRGASTWRPPLAILRRRHPVHGREGAAIFAFGSGNHGHCAPGLRPLLFRPATRIKKTGRIPGNPCFARLESFKPPHWGFGRFQRPRPVLSLLFSKELDHSIKNAPGARPHGRSGKCPKRAEPPGTLEVPLKSPNSKGLNPADGANLGAPPTLAESASTRAGPTPFLIPPPDIEFLA